MFDLKLKVHHSDLYWRSIDFAHILILFMDLPNCGFGQYCEWSHINCLSVWPISHGPGILPHVFKTISWICLILGLMVGLTQANCRLVWPLFHGPFIWTDTSNTISWIALYLDYVLGCHCNFILTVHQCYMHFVAQWFCQYL